LLRGLFIKLFFYSFIASSDSLAPHSLTATVINQFGNRNFHLIALFGDRYYALLSNFSFGNYHVKSIEVSFVNSFYFTFYYVYFIGIIIFFISVAVSFIGYTLVFGNLSYYGVIVVLGIISSVPSLLSYIIQFFFLFFSFLLILFIIVFLLV